MKIIETNAIEAENALLFTSQEHFFLTEYTVSEDGYYNFRISYAHDDWEAYVKFDISYPDDGASSFMHGLLHGKVEMTIPMYMKKGTNKVRVSQISKYETYIYDIENIGLASNLVYEISPKNDVLFADEKKEIKTFVKNWRDRLIKVMADGKVRIDFTCVPRDESNEFSAAKADIYHSTDAVYALGMGRHTLAYTFESGKELCRNIEIRDKRKNCDLQIVNFNVGQANATLICLPNGKTMLVDSGTEKMANNRIIPYLTDKGIKPDYYLLTHFHGDHDGMKDEILKMYSIKSPGGKKCEKFLRKDKKKRYDYLKKFGYLDSTMLCYYDEIHKIWDLGGAEITATGSRYDENGTPTKEYHYSFIKNNEHNYENSTSVSFMLKYKGFGYYHSADNYGYCQDRYMSDMIKMGREKELDCHWFYGNHHFINDINAKFINTLNPAGVYVPNSNRLYHRAAYTHYYKENVENYCFSHKRLKDTLVSAEVGNVEICVNSADDWYYNLF